MNTGSTTAPVSEQMERLEYIIAEIRAFGVYLSTKKRVSGAFVTGVLEGIADRLDAAWKRERVGNVAAMRDVLIKTKDNFDEINNLLKVIIKNTFDWSVTWINSFVINETSIEVNYKYRLCGYTDNEDVIMPIEWLEEGFDYRKAYAEMCMEAKRKAKEAETARKAMEKEIAEEKEYKEYLRLKQKFEENGVAE